MNKMNMVAQRYLMTKVVDVILNQRLCQKCAKKKWKNRKEKTVTQVMGICGNCRKGGLVAYINSDK